MSENKRNWKSLKPPNDPDQSEWFHAVERRRYLSWCVLHVFPKSKCAPKLIQTHYENRTSVRLKHANSQIFKNWQTRVVPARHLWIVPHVLLVLGGPSGCKSLFQVLEHGFHVFLVDYATLRLALAIRFHLLADKCEWKSHKQFKRSLGASECFRSGMMLNKVTQCLVPLDLTNCAKTVQLLAPLPPVFLAKLWARWLESSFLGVISYCWCSDVRTLKFKTVRARGWKHNTYKYVLLKTVCLEA